MSANDGGAWAVVPAAGETRSASPPMYGGGMGELSVGRAQTELLAALLHR